MSPHLQKIKWSDEIAYIVGLITTDGSLSKDGRHINFTSKDIQLIKEFKKCLKLKNKIKPKKSGFSNSICYQIQFGNVSFYKWLLKIGLKPNKTKSIKELKIPNKYFFHFLRGHFDGDGSCYGYWDKRWKNSFLFYVYFLSASHSHIEWLRKKIYKLAHIKGFVDFRKRVWRLNFAKTEAKILYKKMYPHPRVPCLKRKYQKMTKFLFVDGAKRWAGAGIG